MNCITAKFLPIVFSISCLAFTAEAQTSVKEEVPKGWHMMDKQTNGFNGISVDKAYEFVKSKNLKSKTVIVAVIDCGTDPKHEDLKDVLWTNPGEIPENGIDDDKNGYIDDIHGWSFLGGKNGDINYEATELARMYYRMNKKYKNANASSLSREDATEYKLFNDKIKPEFIKAQEEMDEQAAQLTMLSDFMGKVKKQGGGKFTKSTVKSFHPADYPAQTILLYSS